MTILNLLGSFFLLLMVGFLLKKLGIITESGKKCLNDLVVNVVLPCSTIDAFMRQTDNDSLNGFLWILLFASIIQIISIIVGKTFFNKAPPDHCKIMRYSSICSNASFIGYPMAEGVYGSVGLLYASAFLIPQRIVMWTAGLALFSTTGSKKETAKKLLTHPCIIAVVIGLVIMIFSLSLPEMLDNVISSLADCTTPLSMLVIGTVLADVKLKRVISRESLFFCLIRLAVLPALALAVCTAFVPIKPLWA